MSGFNDTSSSDMSGLYKGWRWRWRWRGLNLGQTSSFSSELPGLLCVLYRAERERGSILVCSSACRMTDTEGKSASCDGECYSVNSCLN